MAEIEAGAASDAPLLEVSNLVIEFDGAEGALRAVDGISFAIAKGKTTAVVGESGCGKSVTALSIMGLLGRNGRAFADRIAFAGTDLLQLDEEEMRKLRGNAISMIFQEPMTSLNPVFTTGEQVAEAVRLHQGKSRKEAMAAAVEMFKLVGIPAPEERVKSYPHQMSGGMRQRVMIAIALACSPSLLIADEPTTALDVTIQAQILELLARLQQELGMGVLLITHDLGVVAETCEEVIVMYAGRIVETSSTLELFAHPKHPYTAGLLRSIPGAGEIRDRLQEIPGMVPALGELPKGCKFQDRCPHVRDRCKVSEPELTAVGNSQVRCFFPLDAQREAS